MMNRKRRLLLSVLGAAAFPVSEAVTAQMRQDRPDPRTFEAGDLVWPKKRGAYVPFNATTQEVAVESDEFRWKVEKVAFIKRARAGIGSSASEQTYWRRIADEIEPLDFISFYHRYTAASSPTDFITHGGSEILYVGHVGIIDYDAEGGQPYVVEAILGAGLNCSDCVQRVHYEAWLKARGDILVWHARISGAKHRAAIARYAASQVGKPYDFWNFDLDDANAFYCSKLVWQSVYRTNKVALDGNEDSKRYFWFSPLQTMRSRQLTVMSTPGNYRNV